MTKDDPSKGQEELAVAERRSFFSVFSLLAMTVGLVAGYGALASYAVRFLFPPANSRSKAWQFVTTLKRLSAGQAMQYTAPSGAKMVIARQGPGNSADDFVALSSICPHLGCQVHWESNKDRFFCPCHNGAFDASGQATEGPPAAANQQLTRFPLKVENGLLFVEAPLHSATNRSSEA
jgi:cytochrome b6-f complex iron-sulfur subunit